MVLDPVFKTIVIDENKYKVGYHCKVYHFCSPCTKKLFEEHPENYVEED